MASVQLKIAFEGTLRRLSVPATASLAELHALLATLLGLQDFSLTYLDEENDAITLSSDQELRDVLQGASKITRLTVTRRGSSPVEQAPAKEQAPEPAPAPEQAPKLPFEDVARLLSDPELVHKVSTGIFSSPILTESVNQAARTYLGSSGDVASVLQYGAEQLPMFHALVEDVLQGIPELDEALKQAMATSPASNGLPLPALLSMLGGRGPMRCGPMRCGPSRCSPPADVHMHVVCDGCDASPELRAASETSGHRAGRAGFIKGLRFKSLKVHNFDLCATCHQSGAFAEACGPFEQSGQTKAEDKQQPQAPVEKTEPKAEPEPSQKAEPKAPEDDWVKVQDGLMAKWAPQLELLASLGFAKSESYIAILEEYQGDMEKAVNRIIRREAE